MLGMVMLRLYCEDELCRGRDDDLYPDVPDLLRAGLTE